MIVTPKSKKQSQDRSKRLVLDFIYLDCPATPTIKLMKRKRQSNPEVVLVSWVVCQAEGVRWSSLEAGKLAS